jgi:hypothetical protein
MINADLEVRVLPGDAAATSTNLFERRTPLNAECRATLWLFASCRTKLIGLMPDYPVLQREEKRLGTC